MSFFWYNGQQVAIQPWPHPSYLGMQKLPALSGVFSSCALSGIEHEPFLAGDMALWFCVAYEKEPSSHPGGSSHTHTPIILELFFWEEWKSWKAYYLPLIHRYYWKVTPLSIHHWLGRDFKMTGFPFFKMVFCSTCGNPQELTAA